MGIPHASAQTPQAYQNCASLSKTDPQAALHQAQTWLNEAYNPQAEHCKALALFALARYEEAALALEHVFTRTPPEDISLSVSLLRQAARAWNHTGQPAMAGRRYARAVGILHYARKPTPLTQRLLAETLLEHGEFLATRQEHYAALQEIDQAVALDLLGERALLARARLLVTMQQYAMAQKDAEAALRLSPQHPEAQKILAQSLSQTRKK